MSGFPFDHLTLAEVAECERLAKAVTGRYPTAAPRDHVRLSNLLSKRHAPIYDRPPPGPSAA